MPDVRDEPYVPGYRNNVFISYAWVDNQAGWIEKFHAFLNRRLSELLGRRSTHIWRDSHLHAGSVLTPTIRDEIANSAVFLTILSPGFMLSEYCEKEVKTFLEKTKTTGLIVEYASRFIRIVKTPYEAESVPDVLKDSDDDETIAERFYIEQPMSDDEKLEFDAESKEFLVQAEKVVQSIYKLLRKMKRVAAPAPVPGSTRVFLADTTSDRKTDRQFIMDDLDVEFIVPDAMLLSLDISALEAQLKERIARTELSIHVLGSRYGVRPEGEPVRSIPEMQFDLASAGRRLVWIPEELPSIDADQQAFIERIEQLADERLVVMRSGRQAFLQHIRDVLAKLAEPPVPPEPARGIYLVSELDDLVQPALRNLAGCLRSNGFVVEQPVFEGELDELNAAERITLQETIATIIFYGSARDAWVKAKQRSILGSLGELQRVPQHSRSIYLGDPETKVKRGVYMGHPDGLLLEPGGTHVLVLGDCGPPDCTKIEPLLQRLRAEAS